MNDLTRTESVAAICPAKTMTPPRVTSCIAFDGQQRIAPDALVDVSRAAKQRWDAGATGPLLVFDGHDSRLIELDFRGHVDDVLTRLAPDAAAAQ